VKRIQATVIAGLLLLMLILPQLTLAAGPGIVHESVTVSAITSSSATITWTTNTSADSRVNYGTITALGQYKSDSNNVTNHSVPLTGLNPDTKYYFEVESADASGTSIDNNSGIFYSFTTRPAYSITLEPACGVCGELIDVKTCNEVIKVTAVVAAAGTYHVCWDSIKEWDLTKSEGVVGTFKATTAGSYTLVFFLPEAKKGNHTVYLTTETYVELKKATFEIFPSVKIDPEEGPVGTAVTINCYGFAALQDIRVNFFQGEVKKGEEKTGKADAKGSWEISYTIPDTPSGGYTFKVEAKEGTVWVTRGSKYFKVTPKITATPDSGTVGRTLKVEGTGFAENERNIQVTFDGEVRAANIPANEKGSWDADITIPPRKGGTYIIGASGTVTRARDVPDVEFIVGAGILVEPGLAYVGDTITVAGGGFLPGETGIKVTFEGKVVAADVTADRTGCWETSFVLPASTHGDNRVSASGRTTAAVETTLTTRAGIESVSPIEGAPGDSVTLIGSGFSGNKKLTVTVAGKTVSGDLGTTKSNGDVVITFRVPASTAGKQTLVVKDEGGAEDSVTFTVKTKVLPSPLPILPQDESKLRSGIVTFQWQGITGGSEITYTLQISETAGFTSIFRSSSGIEELSTQLPKEYALPKGTYYWRVKAVDDYGNESPWSDSSSFTASPIPTWVWVVVGLVVLIGLMVVAYRETKFKVTE